VGRSIQTVRAAALAVAITAAAAGAAAAQVNPHPPQAAAPQGRVLSPRDTTRFRTADGRRIYIDYGRPSRRGRRIMGGLVPYGRVWRTGANAATTLVTEADLTIGGTRVPRGTYTLYTIPTAEGWTLIVNRQTGQWGTQYDPSRDFVRIPMRVSPLRQPVEQFTIALEAGRAGANTLALAWENTRAAVPFRVAAPATPRGR
jgi:hypothetical protein